LEDEERGCGCVHYYTIWQDHNNIMKKKKKKVKEIMKHNKQQPTS
jgi:hypothetical protein